MKTLEKRVTNKRLALRLMLRLILTLVSVGIVTLLVVLAQMPGAVQRHENSTCERENISVSYTLGDDKFVPVSNVTESPVVDAPMPETIMSGIIYPKPTNVPSLRQYNINKDSDRKIWSAQNPKSYIIPNDEWVRHVASQLYVEADGRIKYKNKPIPWVTSYKGNVVSWTDEPFSNNYVSDDELFNFPPNGDLWQNADYYLSHGMRGDCEDWSIAITSMMLSGDMSIKENGSYTRQVIPAKVVMGYSGGSKDAWTEYNIHGHRYISSTGTDFDQGVGKDVSITTFHPISDWDTFVPMYQFTDKYFGSYKDDMK